MNTNIPPAPKVGWGILSPDSQIQPETQALIEQILSLTAGQRDALLARAVSRYLNVEMEIEEGHEPDAGDMVLCSTALSNFLFDIGGRA